MYDVLSFRQAIDSGFDPKNYVYGKDVPLGTYEVELDFKIWAKGNTMAVTCYCEIVGSGKLIRFNVFRDRSNGTYFLKGTQIDSRTIPYGTKLTIRVEPAKNGSVSVFGETGH